MTEKLGNVFAHPLPEPLNGIQVGTIAREWHEQKTKCLCFGLHLATAMPRGAIPDNHDLASGFVKPSGQPFQETDRVVTVAMAFMPDETVAFAEIIGTVPVEPGRQRRTETLAPGGLIGQRPGVAQVQILMKMGFIEIEQADFTPTHAFIQRLKFGDKSRTLRPISFAQEFFALFPTEAGAAQERA